MEIQKKMSAHFDHINSFYKKREEELRTSGLIVTATVLAYCLLNQLWKMPMKEYFSLIKSKPTYAELKGWIGEYVTRKFLLLAKSKSRGKIKVDSNPLDNLNKWLSHTAKGADFVIKIGSLLVAVENKFAESLTLNNVRKDVEPRFLTDKEGQPLRRVHYRILLLTNDETYIRPSVKEYLRRKGILLMTTEELKRFLIELSYNVYRHYGYLNICIEECSSMSNCYSNSCNKMYSWKLHNLISSHLRFGYGILRNAHAKRRNSPQSFPLDFTSLLFFMCAHMHAVRKSLCPYSAPQ